MDFWSWLRVVVFGGCVIGGIALAFMVRSAGVELMHLGREGLLNEQQIFLEGLHFEHEKFLENLRFDHQKALREIDAKLRQLPPQGHDDDEVEMLHLLEDFWTARDEV